jgi:hypothetical protein
MHATKNPSGTKQTTFNFNDCDNNPLWRNKNSSYLSLNDIDKVLNGETIKD